MVSDEVLKNAIECYKTTRISALDEVVYECLTELNKLRNNNDTTYNQALDDIKNELCQDDENYFYPCICPSYLEEIINGLKK